MLDLIRENAILICYFVIISIIAVIVTAKDKIRAINGGRRTSETALFAISALGGSLMMLLMMLLIRHKTKHKRFMIGIPLIIVLQAVIIFVAYTML